VNGLLGQHTLRIQAAEMSKDGKEMEVRILPTPTGPLPSPLRLLWQPLALLGSQPVHGEDWIGGEENLRVADVLVCEFAHIGAIISVTTSSTRSMHLSLKNTWSV
jgi:hypothetical protein